MDDENDDRASGSLPAGTGREKLGRLTERARAVLARTSERDRFERFTARARSVLVLAQEEAKRLNHNYIGTEHILLGLLREDDGGVAARTLRNLGVELQPVRGMVERLVGRGEGVVVGEMCLTPRSKRVFELAHAEAQRLKHRYIGTEHLLLGLLREGEGIGSRALASLGVSLEQARTQVLEALAGLGEAVERGAAGTKSHVVMCRVDDRDLDVIDALVEAGVRTTRSDAASWLIRAGIEANTALLDSISETVAEIRRLREVACSRAQQVLAGSTRAAPGTATADDGGPPPGQANHPV